MSTRTAEETGLWADAPITKNSPTNNNNNENNNSNDDTAESKTPSQSSSGNSILASLTSISRPKYQAVDK